ncbi:MAG: hypothetical protein SGI92_16030 [Bryobacteraceae bacterium]|nr:hypothetical protein [Bryobacteraceae bacterium]
MKLRSFLLLMASAAAVLTAADSARLLEIRYVYVMPMSGGLDQYLANRLTANGRYVVVTDPTLADALLTDQVGATFEDKYKELYPPPPPPPEVKPAADKDKKPEEKSLVSLMSGGTAAPRNTSFSRGKGNVFLVDRGSHNVVWSTFLRPKNSGPAEMNHAADEIVDRMDDEAKRRAKGVQKASAAVVPAPKPAPAPAVPPAANPAPAPAPAK